MEEIKYTIPCQNCKGKGVIPHFKHIEDGICFNCYGSKVEEVDKETYDSYIRTQERLKKGKYILFNRGNIEYYKTAKEIYKKYGNFYCGSYGVWSISQSYKDENIVYGLRSDNDEKFINDISKEYQTRLKKETMKTIDILKGMLENEEDENIIELVTNKIKELEKTL